MSLYNLTAVVKALTIKEFTNALADLKAYECIQTGDLCSNWLLFGLIFVILSVFVSKSISLLLTCIHRSVSTEFWTRTY